MPVLCMSGACFVPPAAVVLPSLLQLIYGGSGPQGTLSDLWVLNLEQGAWNHVTTHGDAPTAREMHSACMVDDKTMLVYGGRAADGR